VRVAVVGAGVVGMSTTAALLRAGVDAVCFERSPALMGERSAGSSRIFRLAHTDPDLVRLAADARDGFAEWAARAGRAMVDRCGCVVSGGDAAERATAMEAVGASFAMVEPGSDLLRLPSPVTASPMLVDPEGGVVDVDAVRAFLVAEAGPAVVHEPVVALDDAADGVTVRSAAAARRFDAVVLAAGAGTSVLAAQVGIATPAALVHHARFTFPFDDRPADGARWQAWIDSPAEGLATYQHRSGPGRWSVGGSVDPALIAWKVGPDAAVAASQEVVLAHARARLAVRPEIVETLYCTHTPDTGDGIEFHRAGPVVAVHGENLMKFAPVLGEMLVAAVLEGSTPAVTGVGWRGSGPAAKLEG
jgi:sarcosine oxidase